MNDLRPAMAMNVAGVIMCACAIIFGALTLRKYEARISALEDRVITLEKVVQMKNTTLPSKKTGE